MRNIENMHKDEIEDYILDLEHTNTQQEDKIKRRNKQIKDLKEKIKQLESDLEDYSARTEL